jgi:hypothetical protein
MDKKKLSGLAALTLAFGLGACSHTTVETPTPSASTGATVTTTTTASADTTAKRDSAAGYQASGTTTTSTTVTTPSTTVTTPSTTVTTPAASATVTATANGAQTLVFTPVNNSGFTGNVTLTDMGDHTRVAVTLNSPANTNASADHNAAIHTGTCAAPGAKIKGLSDVEGNGTASNTDLDMRLAELTDGQHIVVVNENPGDRAIVCVAIPSK